jgi:DNA-binding NarL/FixJ family response regulator
MKVLIIDDSALIRIRLVTLLEAIAGVEVVGQAESVAAGFLALRKFKPDVLLLDLQLPDGNGLDVLKVMHQERSPTVVVVLTNYPHAQYERRARATGAHAFLNKARDIGKIPDLLAGLKTYEPPHGERAAQV